MKKQSPCIGCPYDEDSSVCDKSRDFCERYKLYLYERQNRYQTYRWLEYWKSKAKNLEKENKDLKKEILALRKVNDEKTNRN